MSVVLTLAALLGFIVLTAGTAVFVAAEFSLTALERSTVDANARSGGRRDKLVQRAHKTLSFQLSGAQVGISITTLITGYLAEPLLAELLKPLFTAMSLKQGMAEGLSLGLALLIATSVSMVFGELVPQYLAVAKPMATARVVAGPQLLFSMFTRPVIFLTNGTANWILRRLGIEPAEELRSARSPQELVSLVRNSARQGSIDITTATLMDRSLRFGTRSAEELMTPRSKIEALGADDTVADLVDEAIKTGYSRFPIIDGDLDETMGIVHVKQVFSIPPAQRAKTKLASIAQPVPVVPSTLDGDAVMAQILASTLQTALVADEYGGIAGMVTGEDLIEEIVGDVRDEHDDVSPTSSEPETTGWCRAAAHRRGRHRDALPRTPRRIRDHRRAGPPRAGPHPGGGRVGRAHRVRPGLAERRADAVAGDRGAHGRPPHRPDQARPTRFRPGGRTMKYVLASCSPSCCWPDAFFVAAEFALISARRDRSEGRAEQGRSSAVAVIRAGGEPCSTDAQGRWAFWASLCAPCCWASSADRPWRTCWKNPSTCSACPTPCSTRCPSSSRMTVVVVLRVLLGEMVPKNIAVAGPEAAAMLLVPPSSSRSASPSRSSPSTTGSRRRCLARVRRRGRERAREHGVDDRVVGDDRRIAVGGSARSREHHRLSRALQIRTGSSEKSRSR